MLNACLLGCGGTMPLPGRPLTALHLSAQGSGLLIDCGEGTQVQLRAYGRSFYPLDTICFTHYHADHIAGLPGLLLSMGLSGREKPVTLAGPVGLEKTVAGLRVLASELPFEVRLRTLREETEIFDLNGYRITAFACDHGIPCYGYAVEIPRAGKFDPERARAQGVPLSLWKTLQGGACAQSGEKVFRPEDVLGPARRGIKVVYATDTRPVPAIARVAEGADLLILEGMYGDPGKAQVAASKRHMTMQEAARIAREAQPKELWLTHFSMAMPEPDAYLADIRELFPRTLLGEGGMEREIPFP